MKRSGNSTHHCRSLTPTLNGCELTPSTRTQSSEQEYSYLMASKRHPSTPYSRNIHQRFSRGTRLYTFPMSTKHVYVFGMLPGLLENLLESENLVCRSTAATKSALVACHPTLVPIFSRHLAIHPSWETKQRDAPVVGSFTPVSHFAYGDDHFATLSVPFQNAMSLDTHESAKPFGLLTSPNSLSNFLQLSLSSDLAAASDVIDAQLYGSFHLCKVKTFRLKNFAQFFQVRWQCWQKESTMLKFFVFISGSKTTHIASFLFFDSCFSAAQIPKISLLALTLPHSTTSLFCMRATNADLLSSL